MYKKYISVILVVCFVLLLTACNINEKISSSKEKSTSTKEESSISKEKTLELKYPSESKEFAKKTNNKEYDKEYHSIESFDAGIIGQIAGNDNYIFYVSEEVKEQSNDIECAKIYSKNIMTEAEELVYEDKSDGLSAYCELLATEDYLFWCKIQDKRCFLQKYDLKGQETKTIAECDETEVIALSCDSNYLTWYGHKDDKLCIYVYQIDNEKIITIEDENMKISTPFLKAKVNDGIVSYHRNDTQSLNQIVLYNLKTNKFIATLDLPKELIPYRVSANKKYIAYQIYEDTGMIYDLFAYNYKDETLYQVNKTGDLNIFSFDLLDDKLFITDNSVGKVVLRDLSNGCESIITDKGNKKSSYILPKLYNDNFYISDPFNYRIFHVNIGK